LDAPTQLSMRRGRWWLDLDTGHAGWDATAGAMLGWSARAGTGDLLDRVHPDDRPRFVRHCEELAAGRATAAATFRVVPRRGPPRWLRSLAALAEAPASAGRIAGTLRPAAPDLPDAAPAAAAASRPLPPAGTHRLIVEASGDVIRLLARDGRILFANDPDDGAAPALIGRRWSEMLEPASAAKVRRMLPRVAAGEPGRFTIRERTAAGVPRWWDVVASPARRADAPAPADADGPAVVVVARDITGHKRLEERATWLARHDALTELPNRLFLQTRLDDHIAGPDPAAFALLLLDLDQFKQINDTLGHDAGDDLLRAFARQLRRAAPPPAFVARLGGDEFAVMIETAGDAAEVARLVDAIRVELNVPLVAGGRAWESRASIGVSLFPRLATSRSELMKQADLALYAAKASRAGVELFRPAMRQRMEGEIAMRALARTALRDGRIEAHYQPQVELGSGAVIGFEALLRWRDPTGALRRPDDIAAAFDDPDLAPAISRSMLDQVTAQMRRWRDDDRAFGHVALNAAAADFWDEATAERILEALAAANLPAEQLQLEVTESVFLGPGADGVERSLRRLSRAGVRIALDDFGTGHASLTHLIRYPVDVLKIDRSFVSALDGSGEARAVVAAMIELGRSLGLAVIAEGIETQAQEAQLIALGCRFGQGYRYGAAAPAAEAMAGAAP